MEILLYWLVFNFEINKFFIKFLIIKIVVDIIISKYKFEWLNSSKPTRILSNKFKINNSR